MATIGGITTLNQLFAPQAPATPVKAPAAAPTSIVDTGSANYRPPEFGAPQFTGPLPAQQKLSPAQQIALNHVGLPQTSTGNIVAPTAPKTAPTITTGNPVQVAPTSAPTPVSDPTQGGLLIPATPNFSSGATGANSPFSLSMTNVPSSSLATGGPTATDVLTKRQQMENSYLQTYQQYADAQTAENVGKLNDMGREQNALYSGDTTDFGLGLSGLVKNQDIIKQAARATQTQGALLQTQGISNALGFENQDIQNTLAAAPQLGNVQVTATGDVIGTQRDPVTGAVSPLNLGNIYNGTYSGTAAQGQSSSQGLPSAAIAAQYPNPTTAQAVSRLSSVAQPYVDQGPSGMGYIDDDRVPQNLKDLVQNQAKQAGIPYLTSGETQGVQSLDVIFKALNGMKQLATATLSNGIGGRIEGLTLNPIEQFLQTGPDIIDPMTGKATPRGVLLNQFNQYKDAAAKAVTALAGGNGSGLRLNNDLITIASNNLPTSDDNLQNVTSKIAYVTSLLNNQLSQKFPGINLSQNQSSSAVPTAAGGKTGNPTVGWGSIASS